MLRAWFFEREWSRCLRVAVFTGLGIVLWKYNSKAVQDVIIWSVFLYALARRPKGCGVWRNAAGFGFIAVFLYTLVTVPFSVDPGASGRDFVKLAEIAAFAFALPVILDDERKVAGALLYTGIALTLIFAFDLVRLIICVPRDFFLKAHEYEPFVMGHSPNIAAVASGAAFIILFGASLGMRGRRPAQAGCAAGMLVNLAYLVVIASRGAQLALAVTAAVAGLLLVRRGGIKRAALLGLLVAVVALIVCLNPRFRDAVSMRGFSDRDKVWSHTWRLAREHPVLGYGYGRRVFKEVYHGSNPPAARFHFDHPHQYWLNVLFANGWAGVALHAAAWGLLAARLLRHTFGQLKTWAERVLPITIILLLVFLHAFGMGDYPGSVARMMMVWLIPPALTVTANPSTPTPLHPGEGGRPGPVRSGGC